MTAIAQQRLAVALWVVALALTSIQQADLVVAPRGLKAINAAMLFCAGILSVLPKPWGVPPEVKTTLPESAAAAAKEPTK